MRPFHDWHPQQRHTEHRTTTARPVLWRRPTARPLPPAGHHYHHHGDIDDMNVDGVAAHTSGFALPETAFVLDLAAVDSFSARGITLLRRVDQTCDALGIPWCLIPSATVTEQLRTARAHHHFPIADSVPHAPVSFTENIETRRRLISLLGKTA
jgi:anti-anti-sigma regulatory factor